MCRQPRCILVFCLMRERESSQRTKTWTYQFSLETVDMHCDVNATYTWYSLLSRYHRREWITRTLGTVRRKSCGRSFNDYFMTAKALLEAAQSCSISRTEGTIVFSVSASPSLESHSDFLFFNPPLRLEERTKTPFLECIRNTPWTCVTILLIVSM